MDILRQLTCRLCLFIVVVMHTHECSNQFVCGSSMTFSFNALTECIFCVLSADASYTILALTSVFIWYGHQFSCFFFFVRGLTLRLCSMNCGPSPANRPIIASLLIARHPPILPLCFFPLFPSWTQVHAVSECLGHIYHNEHAKQQTN
jgi:hypothetical protein